LETKRPTSKEEERTRENTPKKDDKGLTHYRAWAVNVLIFINIHQRTKQEENGSRPM
jgi:hypothetical protein